MSHTPVRNFTPYDGADVPRISQGFLPSRKAPANGAQLEQLTLNQRVQGSSPCAPTTKKIIFCYRWSFGATALTF